MLSKLLPLLIWVNFFPNAIHAAPADQSQRVPGTTLKHFGKVDDGVYKGSKPRSSADFRFLQSQHIRYLLDLELIPTVRASEQKKARRHGMELIHIRINASPLPPSEEHIARIMATLRDRKRHPIYIHCAYGRDRTALVAGLYKMYYLGMSEEEAWQYMLQSGYKESWVRGGLKKYLRDHPTPPRAAVSPGF